MFAVTHFSWEPHFLRLVICTGGTSVFMWTKVGVVTLRVLAPGAETVRPTRAEWAGGRAGGGGALCLSERERFVCARVKQRAVKKCDNEQSVK